MTYAFEGNVIRLTQKDYNLWLESFCYWMDEADYLRKLSDIDNWMAATLSDQVKKRWFIITSKMLEREMLSRLEETKKF